MICGLDDIKSTIVIFFILAFLSIIVYYFHERVQYLEQSVSRQNQVLSDFISNVQRQVVNSSHLGGSDIKIVKSDEMDKIVISEDDDSESEDDDSESEDDTDSESECDSESYGNDHDIKNNIKVIELIDKEDEDEDENEEEESHLQEMNISDTSSVSESASASASASAYSNSNVKKIDLTQKEDKSNEDGESDIVGSKKMSVAELRALVVSKGLANQNSANKMKKLELIEALGKL